MIKSLLELDWVIMVIDIGGQSYRFLCSGTVLSIPVSMLFIDLRLCKTGLNKSILLWTNYIFHSNGKRDLANK